MNPLLNSLCGSIASIHLVFEDPSLHALLVFTLDLIQNCHYYYSKYTALWRAGLSVMAFTLYSRCNAVTVITHRHCSYVTHVLISKTANKALLLSTNLLCRGICLAAYVIIKFCYLIGGAKILMHWIQKPCTFSCITLPCPQLKVWLAYNTNPY